MLNLLVAAAFLLALPSFLPENIRKAIPASIPQPTINLGLDLAGGRHILLEEDVAQLEKDRLETLEDSVRNVMRRTEPRVAIDEVTRTGGNLSFMVTDSAQIDAAREAVLPLIANNSGGRDWTLSVSDGNRITLTPA